MAVKTIICKGHISINGKLEKCNKRVLVSDAYKVPSPQTKDGYMYMCSECYHRQENYYTENATLDKQPKAHGFTDSIEFEMTNHNHPICRYLQVQKWLPTYDSTVSIEYKSPIFQSHNGIAKTLRTMEQYLDNSYFGEECGTHHNVGHFLINEETIGYIRRFYHSLFLPLSNIMQNNPEATKAIYGRTFAYWSRPIDEQTSPTQHTNFVNLEHITHIEFRTAKFINARQYVDMMKMNRAIVSCILNNFIEHFNSMDFDTRRYKNITEFRKHKANLTGEKIAKLFIKEASKHGFNL